MDEIYIPVGLSVENYMSNKVEKPMENKMEKPMDYKTGNSMKDGYDRLSGSYYGAISSLPKDTALTMAYVPFQTEMSPHYEAEEAMKHGTLFPALNKPFLGAGKA